MKLTGMCVESRKVNGERNWWKNYVHSFLPLLEWLGICIGKKSLKKLFLIWDGPVQGTETRQGQGKLYKTTLLQNDGDSSLASNAMPLYPYFTLHQQTERNKGDEQN